MYHLIDKSVLYTLNWRVGKSLEESYEGMPTFAEVLENTQVDRVKTAVYTLTAPGEHAVHLQTLDGPLTCHARVHLDADPRAPLLIYHHGINEYPYTNSWRRIFRNRNSFPVHNVCVQAPFHHHWSAPLSIGFASLQNLYQMLAGSLRVMELIQDQFEEKGVPYTVIAGSSWGGMTSMLYEGLFQRAQAIIPMMSSPDLAQVLWDIAEMFNRPVPLPLATMKEHLDFTPIYRRCDPRKIFPLMGENDLFFQIENHPAMSGNDQLTTIPTGHITGMWQSPALRRHIGGVLEKVDKSALS